MNKNIILVIIVLLVLLLIPDKLNVLGSAIEKKRRHVRFTCMIEAYRLYALWGLRAMWNVYPVDYPHKKDLLPVDLRVQYNRIAGKRVLNGNNNIESVKMKKIMAEMLQYCEQNLTPVTANATPVVSIDDVDTIRKMIKEMHPFVIRNYACKTNKKYINVSKILEKYGDTTVLFTANNESYSGLLKDIEKTGAYVANSTSFLKKHPEIFNEEDISKITKVSGLRSQPKQMFMGLKKNQGTPVHCAFSSNFYFMVEGKKKWTIWHPDYLHFMYPYFPESGVYMGSLTGVRDMDNDEEIVKNFPMLKYAPRYEVVLEEGDILWNPGPWWHAIRNMTEKSLAFATRWDDPTKYFPSPYLLAYNQINNKSCYDIFKHIYVNTGELRFDVDEHSKQDYADDDLSLLEKLNHASDVKLKFEDRHKCFVDLDFENDERCMY